jgi:hypothetical protein
MAHANGDVYACRFHPAHGAPEIPLRPYPNPYKCGRYKQAPADPKWTEGLVSVSALCATFEECDGCVCCRTAAARVEVCAGR